MKQFEDSHQPTPLHVQMLFYYRPKVRREEKFHLDNSPNSTTHYNMKATLHMLEQNSENAHLRTITVAKRPSFTHCHRKPTTDTNPSATHCNNGNSSKVYASRSIKQQIATTHKLASTRQFLTSFRRALSIESLLSVRYNNILCKDASSRTLE